MRKNSKDFPDVSENSKEIAKNLLSEFDKDETPLEPDSSIFNDAPTRAQKKVKGPGKDGATGTDSKNSKGSGTKINAPAIHRVSAAQVATDNSTTAVEESYVSRQDRRI